MPVDAVFCDRSGREFNEFAPVDLLLGPYVKDLQSSAAALDAVANPEGETLNRRPKTHAFTLNNLRTLVVKVYKLASLH